MKKMAQRGSVLLEALVSFTVLAIGLLTLAKWQVTLRGGADIAAQRSEAVRMAEAELETLRASTGVVAPTTRSALTTGAIALRLTRRVDPAPPGEPRGIAIDVAWTDRAGGQQHVRLQSLLSGSDPTLGGALNVAGAASARAPVGPLGRAASIPIGARDLGDGRSALRPVAGGSLAYVFDNASGRLTQRCEQGNAAAAAAELTIATLGGCEALSGLLLSGNVRFALGSTPDPDHANDAPLPFAVGLRLSGGSYPVAAVCSVQAMKGVAYRLGAIDRTAQVPLDAVPNSVGATSWTDTGERYAGYVCSVGLRSDGRWSGRFELTPSGWTLGAGAGAFRLCRYVADLDGSGAIDANREHPAVYSAVDGALSNQNYLAIRGNRSCPAPATQPQLP